MGLCQGFTNARFWGWILQHQIHFIASTLPGRPYSGETSGGADQYPGHETHLSQLGFPFFTTGCVTYVDKVALEDGWHEVDAHIIDYPLLVAAKAMLFKEKEFSFGYGLGPIDPQIEGDWNQGFVQTGALIEDHGEWEEAGDFYTSALYHPLNWFHKLTMPMVRTVSNHTLAAYRNYGHSLLRKQQTLQRAPVER